MPTSTEMQAYIAKLAVNMGRLDGIVNGPESGSGSLITTDAGNVPSMARFLSELNDTIIPHYSSLAAAQAEEIPDRFTVIRVTGRTEEGIGGAWYVRNPTTQSPFQFTDADGAKWEPARDPSTLTAIGGGPTGLSVTVGAGSDFSTISEAIAATEHYKCTGNQMIDLVFTSPVTAGHTFMGDHSRYRLKSAIGDVPVLLDFNGASNLIFEDGTSANTIATVYKSTKCLFVGWYADMPRISCMFDMQSPRGSTRLGHGITMVGGSIHFDGGCGVKNAGLCGLSTQLADIYAIGATITDSGAENVRTQQAGKMTLQDAIADRGCVEGAVLGSSVSGASVFVSRASCANVTLLKSRDSFMDAFETHGAFFRGAEMTLTDAARNGYVGSIGSNGSLQGSVITGAGNHAVIVSNGANICLTGTDLRTPANFSLVMTAGGGTVNLTDAQTKSSSTTAPVLADVDGVYAFNWPGQNGIVFANVDGPLQRMGLLNNGTYSETGASNGKTIQPANASVISSSRDGTGTQAHYEFANATGSVVGRLNSSGAGVSLTNVSDSDLKGNIEPLREEIDPLQVIRDIEFVAYDARRGPGGEFTGERRHGVVYQQVESILPPQWLVPREHEPGHPEFVAGGVDYVGAGYYAAASVQILDEIIQGLLADRDQMLARIAALEAGQ